jgi:hypothetical protein
MPEIFFRRVFCWKDSYVFSLRPGGLVTASPAPGSKLHFHRKHPAVIAPVRAAQEENLGGRYLSVRNEIMYTFVEIQNVCKQTNLISRSIKKYFRI